MMKRLLAALAAVALLSGDAFAGRVLVIKANSQNTSVATNASSRYLSLVTGVLDALGVDYDVMPQGVVAATTTSHPGNLNQNALRTGTVYLNSSSGAPTRQYSAIIHMNFFATNTGSALDVSLNRCGGYNPDTLTRAASWPVIPHVFFGPPRIHANNLFATTATCSTGVSGTNGLWSSSRYIGIHSPGYPEVFKTGTVGGIFQWYEYNGGPGSVKRAAYTDRIVKNRISMNATALHAYGGFADSAVSDADKLLSGRAESYFSSSGDTSIVWTIERHANFRRYINGAIVSTPDSGMLIFATPAYTSNGGTENPATIIAMTIAMLDSACTGTIIGQKSNWSPKRIALVVSGAFTRSSSFAHGASGKGHGVVVGDSVYIKAGIDSLASLRVPVTVTLDPDSVLAEKEYEKFWWSRLPEVRYGYEPAAAMDSLTTGAAINADSLNSPDPFGWRRSRTVSNYTVLAGGSCSTTDTSLTCLLWRARNEMLGINEFSSRVGRFMLSPWADYIPFQYSRTNTPGEDTLSAAFKRAGFDCAGIDATRLSDFTTTKNTANGDQLVSISTGYPANWSFRQRQSRSAYGYDPFKWLAFRSMDEDNTGNTAGSHDMQNEFFTGLFYNPWYLTDLNMRNHEFKTPMSLFVIRPGDLGCSVPVTNDVVRPGWFQIKWIVNQVRLINKFCGRTVISIGYPEDITP